MPTLTLARTALALTFAYQGIVPKLWTQHADERTLALALGLGSDVATWASRAFGIAELGLALVLLMLPRARWPYGVILVLMPVLLLYVAWAAPAMLLGAFNPVASNVAIAALAGVALCELRRTGEAPHSPR